jgi:hypothetical protein
MGSWLLVDILPRIWENFPDVKEKRGMRRLQ